MSWASRGAGAGGAAPLLPATSVPKNLISVDMAGSEVTVDAVVLVTSTDMVGSPVLAFASVSGGA